MEIIEMRLSGSSHYDKKLTFPGAFFELHDDYSGQARDTLQVVKSYCLVWPTRRLIVLCERSKGPGRTRTDVNGFAGRPLAPRAPGHGDEA